MILLGLLVSIISNLVFAEDNPLVCLDSGTCYKGGWSSTSSGIQYANFQGIRFAKAPTGNLRFRPPQKLDDENLGTLDVSTESKVACLQAYSNGPLGQEDCLLLNVYIPEKIYNDQSDQKYPVMFWIYGGGFAVGDATFFTYGPQPFMDKDVIIVTANYRLGAFGFLSLGINEAEGNAGLLDQNLALQWVQKYVGQFKGDPNMVTIFGESAGSLSVALQIVSPMSKGLFQRAILQSGVVLAPTWHFIPTEEATFYGTSMATLLNCTSEEDYLECLQSKDPNAILQAEPSVYGLSSRVSIWMPTIDSAFLPERPIDILEKGDFDHDLQVIVGSNAADGLLFINNSTDFQGFRENFDTVAPAFIYYKNQSEVTQEDSSKAKKTVEHYIGSINNYNFDHINQLIDLYTDGFCLYGNYKFSDYLMNQGVTVYQYILSYVGSHSFSITEGTGVIGANHGDDCLYLWTYQNTPMDSDDVTVSNIMTKVWTDFATYGDPTPPGSDFSWTPLKNISNFNFWNISGPNPAMEHSDSIQERMELWQSVLEDDKSTAMSNQPNLEIFLLLLFALSNQISIW